MNHRERFVACILGEPLDRAPYWLLWQPWRTTWERWQREGLPENFRGFGDVERHFDADVHPRVIPVNLGPCPRMERTVLEESDQFVVYTDTWGIKRRDFKDHESMSQFLEFPVKDRAGWERFREERLDPDLPGRLAGDWRQRCADWSARGWPIQLGYYPDVTVFGGVRWLLGDEECLLAFYTMPDLVHEIMDHLTGLYLTVFEKVCRQVHPDVIHVWEDMCGRQGPLISPRHWEEFMGPCYGRIRRFAREHDIPAISVDTDGNPEAIIPPMMRGGVNFLYPMEVAAGCDVNAVQARHPRLAMMGGIDKRALALGPAAIDRELKRVEPAVRKGRYIPELDHLVPDDVSWDNYAHYARRLKDLVGKG